MEAREGDVFVGRARDLAVLEGALVAARTGSGAAVIVAGDAGIGKSRLAAELAGRARTAGFEVLVGRSIDLVGTELPFQPFVDALRPLGDLWRIDDASRGSQLRVFETTLALLTERATVNPVLLVLEDLHWADTSTLDLTVFLAHHLHDRPVLLLATYRADEPASGERTRRLADGARRSGSAVVLELGPLGHVEMSALLAARSDGAVTTALANEIVVRSEGNPFFAEELLAAAGDRTGELPRGVRDLLLERVAKLDRPTQGLLRVAAAAGRDVAYPLLCAVTTLREHDVRESLRRAVEHGVLVADRASEGFRFRHALLAETVYGTILPGEREELHALLAEALARRGAATPAELAPHWAAAGRTTEALVASVEAARQAEAVFGLAEALAHVERALALWDAVPGAAELVHADLVEICSWAADLASQAGAAPRAVELGERAIELAAEGDPRRTARLYGSLGHYLHERGRTTAALAAFERAVELVPAQPPSAERAQALEALAHGLMLEWRFDESLPVCEQALALAREVGAHAVELRASLDVGRDLAYLGRADEGMECLWRGLERAEERGDPRALLHAYVALTDVLMMLGRPGESARVGARGLEVVRRYGIDSTVLVANSIEALLAIGEWDEADRMSAAALRAITANFPYMLLGLRGDLELGRGDFDNARGHLEAALVTLREDHGQGMYDIGVAELALWEHRWLDADEAARRSLAHARTRPAAQLRVWFCAKALRVHAELAALARARRDPEAHRSWLAQARKLIAMARRDAREAATTPNVGGWLALAEAEYERARGVPRPELWSRAAEAWDRVERPPLVAYCRWREAEALAAGGASRTEASGPLGSAYAIATRLGARPLARELELLAQRARLDLAPPDTGSDDRTQSMEEALGLTRREAEVLTLVARGYTNREVAATLVISVKTASVHVSHILHKLGATNRLEAAAIAHQLAPPPSGPLELRT